MIITGKSPFLKLFIISIALFAFMGCAVMTVDVDVYKGPMSNHEDVQMQQLAVMAVGAEPLLVRLRDGLEWGHFSRKNVKETGNIELDIDGSLVHKTLRLFRRDKAIEYSRDNIQYSKSALYDIPKKNGNTGEKRIFKDDTADAVNGILALYDGDAKTEGIKQLLEKYLDAINKDGTDNAINEKNNLLYAMVRFAEKILILTNNEVLIGDGNLFGDGLGFLGNEKFKYTTLLQSIGNSILVQADEIKHQESHEKSLKKKVGSEILALNNVLSRSPEKVIGDIISSVEAQLTSVQNKSSENLEKINSIKVSREETINSFPASPKPILVALTGADDAIISKLENNVTPIGNFITSQTKLKNLFMNSFEILEEKKAKVLKQKNSEQVRDISVKDLASEFLADYVNKELNPTDPVSLTMHKYARWKDIETFLTGGLVDRTVVKSRQDAYDELIGLAKVGFDKADHFVKKAVELKNSNNQLSQLYKSKKDIPGKIIKIENTKAIIVSIKDEVLKNANSSDLQASGPIVFAFLKDVISRELKAEKDKASGSQDPDKITQLTDALNVIAKDITPPIGSLDLAGKLQTDGDTNAKDILDTLITVLRDEHIMAIKENKGYAKNIENALAAAYEHRSSMVYIRPPSAFLRSSYPVTTFQDSPQLGWRNMLGESGLKSIPVVSSLYGWASSAHSRQKVREEIDKQFWHNINRVRVSGAGNTNYVVAKDDVGNWYVKSYSSDTKDIIKAAQSLAMFNLSGSMGVGMVDRLKKYTENTPGKSSETKSDTSLSSIERLYVKHTNSFNQQTIDDYNLLVSMLNGNEKIKTKIQNAVDSIIYVNENRDIQGKLKSNLESVSGNILDPAVSKLEVLPDTVDEKRVREAGNKIIDLLFTTIRYRNVLTANITSQNMITDTATTELESEKIKKKNQEGELKAAIDEFNKEEVDLGNKTVEINKQKEKVKRLKRDRDSWSDALRQIQIANANSNNPDTDTSTIEKAVQESGEEYDTARSKLEAMEEVIVASKSMVTVAKEKVKTEKDELVRAEERVNVKEGLLEKANKAEELVVDKITGEIRDAVVKLYNRRNDSVNSYGTSVTFIGDAVNPVSGTDELNIRNELKDLSSKGIN